jgi:predicted amidohydrolase YtcJ
MATSLINGKVYTGNPAYPWARSLRFENGFITGVDEPASAGDEIVDAHGQLVLPAFGDGHAHPMFAGFEFLGPAIRGKATLDQVLSAVAEFAQDNPDREWIIGGSYESWMVPNGEFDARWLDEVVPDRPVVLRASDYHTIWCNTAALQAAGITSQTADPELGWILRRPDGSPLGTLREWDAVDLVLNAAPAWSLNEQVRALELASREFARSGTTWVQDAWVDPGMEEAYVRAAHEDRLHIRYNLALRADARSWRNQLDWFVRARDSVSGIDKLSVNTIKFFADGVIEGKTAAVRGGYRDDPHNLGMPCWDWNELRDCVAAIDAFGFQPHIHAIGDEGLHQAINAIEHAQAVNGDKTHPRPVITHVQLLDPADLPRFARLGIVANFEPLWACNDPLQSELTAPQVGPEREMWQYPMKSLLNSGAHISFGSDWPVTEQNPLECMQVAITRMVPGDAHSHPWNPTERISLTEGIAAYTSGNAYQAGESHVWGTLSEGYSADFVMLDTDIFSVPELAISGANVVGTWCAGLRVFGLAPGSPSAQGTQTLR